MSILSPAARRGTRLAKKAGSGVSGGYSHTQIRKFYFGESIPTITDWVTHPSFLNRPNIYPRQMTFLKIIFLQRDLFTQYDYDVIGDWEERFRQTGTEGISPGIHERIQINIDNGRPWFRETQGVIGRRGSKGYTGGLAGSYVLWHYMNRTGGPQNHYGIDRDKQLVGIVFAGKKEQARDNQWKDLVNVITGAPCFQPYVSKPQAERLTVFAPNDFLRMEKMRRSGVEYESDMASFAIIPAPSTVMAGRGPTSFMQFYDEQAHVIPSTSNADAALVYDAATPSLDQFGKDGFIYAPSSPWTKQGKFFENWERAIEMEPNGSPAYPERLMLQLPSWGLYEDWEDARRIPLVPPKKEIAYIDEVVKKRRTVNGKRQMVEVVETTEQEVLVPGPTFKPLKKAIQAYDDDMRQLQRANPDTFNVERLSRWAESLNAYLNPVMVERMFAPWDGRMLFTREGGTLRDFFVAHGDPSNTNKRFGWAIAHREWRPKDPDAPEVRRLVNGEPIGDPIDGMWHVVFDVIRYWDPADYPEHVLDYEEVMGDIWADVLAFYPEDISFDQFNVPATIGWLKRKIAREQLPKQVRVHEVTRTKALNWKHSEIFKSALNMGLVHAPMCNPVRDPDSGEWTVNDASSEGQTELKFLEEKNGVVKHPDSGPVQTKDIADAIFECTVALVGQQMASILGMTFDDVGISGGAPRGTDPGRHTRTEADVAGSRLSDAMGGSRGGGRPTAARGGVQRGMKRR